MNSAPTASPEVTKLLVAWGNGDERALDKLMPLVYHELRRLARQYLNKERPGHTLQTTDLVHEAYLRLVDQQRVHWQNCAHFFGVAAQLMRRILVDQARRRLRLKRGGGSVMVSLDEGVVGSRSEVDMIALDQALTRLTEFDQRKARIVELRFFGGLSVDETADFMKTSSITVMRDWKMAKAWLHRELDHEP